MPIHYSIAKVRKSTRIKEILAWRMCFGKKYARFSLFDSEARQAEVG